ncbi:hypothetical protein VR46_40540, partial [Streptomyces sp. NRRL S-444]
MSTTLATRVCNQIAHQGGQCGQVLVPGRADLLDHDQFLLRRRHREHAAGETGERVVPRGDLALDIVGIYVAAVENDHFFDTAGDVELTVVENAEVPGAQEALRPLGGTGAEDVFGGLGVVPV